MSTQRLALATLATVILCASPALADDPPQSERDSRYTYYVQGVTKGGPVKSESYASKERAFEELERWKKDHGSGGLLESDPFTEGPEVMREYQGKPEPLKPEPIDPKKPQSRPGATNSADGKPLDLFQGLKDKMAAERKGRPAGTAGTVIVRVYKLVDNKWVEQPDRKYETTSEAAAKDYFEKVKKVRGWTATWNAPGTEKPKITMPEMRTVDPGASNVPKAGTESSKRIGYDDAKPKGDSAKAEEKTGYICWYDDFGTYGGMTREEAIKEARAAKRLNPGTHIRVTVHKYTGNMTVKQVEQTPGTTILDLP